MQIHLFSTPGESFLDDILAASKQVLESQDAPVVAYLPAAAEERHFVRETRAGFRGIAEVRSIKPEIHPLTQMRSVLDRASLLYIPGGNTYLAAFRLHASGLMGDIRKRILGGLPLVAFSAGTVLCGVDILTTNDRNECGCTQFSGFGLIPYNFNVHYPPEEGEERNERDTRLLAYAREHHRNVLALADGAYLLIEDSKIHLMKGSVWEFRENEQPHTI